MRIFKISFKTLIPYLIGFLGIVSGFFQLFQIFVKDEKTNEYVFVFCIACFFVYYIINIRKNKTPLRKIDDYFLIPRLNYEVSEVKDPSELEQIVELARSNYTCPINGIDFKRAIWEKNPFTFFVVKDESDDIKANINLLPLTEAAFEKLKSGIILESELKAEDVLSNSDEDKKRCKRIYVEGLLSKSEDGNVSDKNALILIGWNFEKIISNLTVNTVELHFCGIGGSLEGENLMKRLGFHISTPANQRKDKLDFFEVDFTKFKNNLDSKTLVGTIKKVVLMNNN